MRVKSPIYKLKLMHSPNYLHIFWISVYASLIFLWKVNNLFIALYYFVFSRPVYVKSWSINRDETSKIGYILQVLNSKCERCLYLIFSSVSNSIVFCQEIENSDNWKQKNHKTLIEKKIHIETFWSKMINGYSSLYL